MFGLDPLVITIFGIAFIFIMTTLGAGIVFFVKNGLSEKSNLMFFGFAGGVMIAAAIVSLFIPAISSSQELGFGFLAMIPVSIGFLVGCLLLTFIDKKVLVLAPSDINIEKSKFKRSVLLMIALAVHNAPEGLAVGLAFGHALKTGDYAMLSAAVGLAIGIGLQNFPEGAAVSIPLNNANVPTGKSFVVGALSGLIEPIFAIVGILLAQNLQSIMPWFLAFAAGAMVFVVVKELVPGAQSKAHPYIGTYAFAIGFLIMFSLEYMLL